MYYELTTNLLRISSNCAATSYQFHFPLFATSFSNQAEQFYAIGLDTKVNVRLLVQLRFTSYSSLSACYSSASCNTRTIFIQYLGR